MLEDPLTGDFASRIELEDEEEAAIANNLPSQYTVEPTIHVRMHCHIDTFRNIHTDHNITFP